MIVASVVVGAGLGIGLSKLSGNGAGGTAPVAVSPARATGATGTTGSGRDAVIRVLSSTFAPATSSAGRKRRQATVVVRLRASAPGRDAVALGTGGCCPAPP